MHEIQFKMLFKDLEEIPNLYQGDIILRAHIKNGIIDAEYKWPGGVLVYQLDTNFSKIIFILPKHCLYL